MDMKLRNILDEITGKEIKDIKSVGKPILIALNNLGKKPKIYNNSIDSTIRINKQGYMSVDLEDGTNISLATTNDKLGGNELKLNVGGFRKTIYFK
jgi:hypothetical protein|tara:strand:- start:1341 stop:1628 length:288 start_codon:yes stop_codon:yes gene_type:complete